ncbi:LysM peptidoglycan-binding domain-containing protein [Kocuria kalidii]|uniref:LysM peptidoglycan-binding domain-containing protein n=1 Tax=Kocuria kalidii TaxID=3376283 RepID=UPI003798C5F3
MDGRPDRERSIPGPLWPALVVPVLGLGLAACGAALAAEGRVRPIGGPDAGRLIGLAAAVTGCAVVLAWALAAALAVLAVLAGRRRWVRLAEVCGRCSPVLLRRAVATALGLQLMAVPAAVADERPSPFWSGGAAVREAPPSGPDARGPASTAEAQEPPPGPGTVPAPGPAPAPAAPEDSCAPQADSSARTRTTDGAVTVVRGDTLWSLTAAHLGPDATDERIARAWPRWYELNRHVLVDGPHRLLPGQRLLVPDTADR